MQADAPFGRKNWPETRMRLRAFLIAALQIQVKWEYPIGVMSSVAFDITARLSELVETTLKEGPQVVMKDGIETAVLVSMEEWQRLKPAVDPDSSSPQPRRSLKDILLDPNGPHDIYIPPRLNFHIRPVDFND